MSDKISEAIDRADDTDDCSLHLLRRAAALTAANAGLQADVERQLLLDRLGISEPALLRSVIDQVPDYLFVKDLDSRFVLVNAAMAALHTKADSGQLIGMTDFELHEPERAAGFRAIEQELMRTGQAKLEMEETVFTATGEKKIMSTSKVALRNSDGAIIGLIGVARDITQQKAAEDHIRYLAHHDVLTGLPNRALMKERLAQCLSQSARRDARLAVVFIDVDHFKIVNDSLGHDAGDLLLQAVAARIDGVVRSSDTAARLGGDEFVLLLTDQPGNPLQISAFIERLRQAIAAPIDCGNRTLHVTSSIGIATFPDDGTDVETLLRNADAAMYRAKEAGRDCFQFYTADMNDRVQAKLVLQEEIRLGLARSEFALFYQPQVDLRAGRIFGVEALVRWHHPVRGLVSPAEFIPLAEESGLIVALGDAVLRMACRQCRDWQAAGLEPLTVSVNVSARQFQERNWVARVAEVLEEFGLDGRHLELELTESMIMQDVERAIQTMHQLQQLGVQLSIDDFGTGYSSLTALKRFPVTRLKIDRSFVANLATDESDRAIASAVIALGQQLRLRVIAEGVETAEQLDFLDRHACDEMQGYLFSRPVPPDEIEVLLRSQAEASD